MRTVKHIFDFYIESSLHVALAVFALIQITFLKLNISYDDAVAYFGFFGTIVGYNFIKYDELARVKKIRLTKTLKAIMILSLVSAFAAFYYFLELKSKTKLIGFGALILIILYALPFFPNQKNMRNWSGIKIYLVAIAWVGVTVFLPVINAELDFLVLIILKSIQRFILVFVLMLIFEIIDLQFDDLKLHTFPQKLGVKMTKLLNYVLIVLYLFLNLLIFIQQQNDYNNYHLNKELFVNYFEFYNYFIAFLNSKVELFILSLLFLFTFFASPKRNKYFTSFWVESVPIIWLFLLMIFG